MKKSLTAIFVTLSAMVSILFAGSSGMPQLPERGRDSAEEQTKSDKYINMRSDAGRQTELGGKGGKKILIAVGNFAAHHNGTVITCDSTVRYSDTHLECFGKVLINKGTTYIYGDRAEYDGEKNEAKIYSDIIKVVDKGTTLYTYNFTFNTESNIGTFTGGGVVIDGQNRLEADRGYYNADTKDIICVTRVEMRDDKYAMKGDSVIYNMESKDAKFFRHTNIWNNEDNEYLYADCGQFVSADDLYRITENGYILTEEQEVWSDSLDYYRERGYAKLKNNIQIDDTTQKIIAFGDWGEYWKEPGNAFLTQNPAMVSYDTEQSDSLFIRSDSMFFFTKDPVAERLERERKAAARADSIAAAKDSIVAARQTIASSASKSKREGSDVQESSADMSERAKQSLERAKSERKNRGKGGEPEQREQSSPETKSYKTTVPTDSPDSVQIRPDSLVKDSVRVDSLAQDSTFNPLDTLPLKERKAIEKAAAKALKKHIRDSVKAVKADSLRVKLDRIADKRQAAKSAYLKKLEYKDSLRKVRAREIADKKLRRKIARLERRGIFIKPIHDSVFVEIDSLIYADSVPHDSITVHMLDSLIAIYFPRKEVVDTLQTQLDTIAVDSTYKLIMALRNVRMFRSDSQMVCDSLLIRSTDSIIHLYREPVMWSDNNQVTADSMHIYSSNNRLIKALFEGHPMTVAQIDTAHYNQVAGKEMIAYFNENNELYRNDVKGNVQTIYYMQEDENSPEVSMMAYIESGDMTAYIENRQLRGITYRTNPTYYFYPIDKIPEDRETRLKGFKWEEGRRPGRDSVFTRTIRASKRESIEKLPRPHFPIEHALTLRKQRLESSGQWHDRTDTLSLETLEWVESVRD